MSYLEIISCDRPTPVRSMYFGQPLDLAVGVLLPLTADEIRVGRHPGNDLVLPLASVNRFHFRIFRKSGLYVYEDIGSRQMPVYNGERFPGGGKREMHDGDTFSAAEFLFRYRELADDAEPRA